MSRISIGFLLTIIVFSSCKNDTSVSHGDLLFVGSSGSDLGNAITDVTKNDKAKDYSHIAMVFKTGDSLFVIDATPKYGVSVRPIEQFINEEATSENAIDVFRTQLNKAQIDVAVQKISPYVGRPYNHAYLLTDTAFYCSQLIHDAFAAYSLFEMEPMTFKNDGETLPFWKEYYDKLGVEIPEGVPGCNPNGMAAHEDIKFIMTLNSENGF